MSSMSDQISDVASTNMVEDDEEGDYKNKTVHSLVEKKRRDKMAQYVTELSNMIPMCGVMQRKLDKITVLRMAVQHLKAIKGSKVSPSNPGDAPTNAPHANEAVIKAVLEGANCFLFVVACDRGKFLYASESVSNFIYCKHTDLIGQSIFELVHTKDIPKIKEQLIASDVTSREVFINAKTMEPVNPGVIPKEELNIASPGAGRSFFCRMKNRLQPETMLKSEPDVPLDQNKKKRPGHTYVSLHCTGFLKTWASSQVTSEADIPDTCEVSCNLACLVAIAKVTPRLTHEYLNTLGAPNMKPIQFYARLNSDYQFTWAEPMVTYVTGFLPQEVVGSVVYDFFAEENHSRIQEMLEMCTRSPEKLVSPFLKIRTVENTTFNTRVVISSFHNPFTAELEHILLNVTAVASYINDDSDATPMDSSPTEGGARNTASSPSTSSAYSDKAMSLSDGDADDDTEASKAIIMSLLGADGGLGGQVAGDNLSWLLASSNIGSESNASC